MSKVAEVSNTESVKGFLVLSDVLLEKPLVYELKDEGKNVVGFPGTNADICLPSFGFGDVFNNLRTDHCFSVEFHRARKEWVIIRAFDQIEFLNVRKPWVRNTELFGGSVRFVEGLLMGMLLPESSASLDHLDSFKFNAVVSDPEFVYRFEFWIGHSASEILNKLLEEDNKLLHLPDILLSRIVSFLPPLSVLQELHLALPNVLTRVKKHIPWTRVSVDATLDSFRTLQILYPGAVTDVILGRNDQLTEELNKDLIEPWAEVVSNKAQIKSVTFTDIRSFSTWGFPLHNANIIMIGNQGGGVSFVEWSNDYCSWKFLKFPSPHSMLKYLPVMKNVSYKPCPNEEYWSNGVHHLEQIEKFRAVLEPWSSHVPFDKLSGIKVLELGLSRRTNFEGGCVTFDVPLLEVLGVHVSLLDSSYLDLTPERMHASVPKLKHLTVFGGLDDTTLEERFVKDNDLVVWSNVVELVPFLETLVLKNVHLSWGCLLDLLRACEGLRYLQLEMFAPLGADFCERVLLDGIPTGARGSCMGRLPKRTFIDSLRVYVRGGAGGMGFPKFGGFGGNGGNVSFIGSEEASLAKLKEKNPSKRFIAGNGTNSKAVAILGQPGANLDIRVPCGVEVVNELGRVVASIDEPSEKVLVATGGIGGNPTNQYCGQPGRSAMYVLDLKIIADVGLVGFPNAGKSTFLKAISRARPKIAAYPFTTLEPQVGVIKFDDLRTFSIADLPGLIEGAATENRGLGHKFLKHVERTKVLLFVVDLFGFQLSPKHPFRNAFETILMLNRELEAHCDELIDKPAMLLLNKIDRPGGYDKFLEMEEIMKSYPESAQHFWEQLESTGSNPKPFKPEHLFDFRKILPMSAKSDAGSVETVKWALREAMDELGNEKLDLNADEVVAVTESRIRGHGPTLLLFCVTWNVQGRAPLGIDADLKQLLGLNDNTDKVDVDVFAIGLQEIPIGPQSLLNDTLFDDVWSEAFGRLLFAKGFIRVKRIRMLTSLLLVFVRKKHLLQCRDVFTASTRSGVAGVLGNKGSLTVRMTLRGTSLCLVNSHLPAHDYLLGERIKCYNDAVMTQSVPVRETPKILYHDYVFWFGDLNFRLDDEKSPLKPSQAPNGVLNFEKVLEKISAGNTKEILTSHDQLNRCMRNNECFAELKESLPSFPPTYKFVAGTNRYDPVKLPAWCDRILYAVGDGNYDELELKLCQHKYNSFPGLALSDHLPVYSVFSFTVFPEKGIDVKFREPMENWVIGEDALIELEVLHRHTINPFDWVGMFRKNFASLDAYQSYMSVASAQSRDMGDKRLLRVTYPTSLIVPGEYILMYFDHRSSSVLGISSSFNVSFEVKPLARQDRTE
ncbi:unnamed protein product [Notodromas monacha]|uniref:Phosphoinositide 5-phosphatase n=1 Tax=Notodromas monacha TaxID=399045 RepID=A0A7R9BFF0_9CRUS|nr:unnamed protein product [Notodromas monacha]CAG0914413.1 unnamed protein product [Notodromas monacha]